MRTSPPNPPAEQSSQMSTPSMPLRPEWRPAVAPFTNPSVPRYSSTGGPEFGLPPQPHARSDPIDRTTTRYTSHDLQPQVYQPSAPLPTRNTGSRYVYQTPGGQHPVSMLRGSDSSVTLTPEDGVAEVTPVPKFSTPAGPPTFYPPIRPAAVPLRTTSVSSQPLAFTSSGSTLPTSTPSNYPNGALELPLHQTAAVDDSTFESPYVLFSAHKVLKNKKQANVPSLGFGAMVSPGREISPGPQVVEREPHRCKNCGAYANLYCEILLGSGQWQCVICKKLNDSNGEYAGQSKGDLQHLVELSYSAIDYIQAANRQPPYIPVPEKRPSAPIFIVIDECLDEAHLQHLQGSLHAFLEYLPPTTRIGIISYGRTVSVYDFSEGSMASADVLPGGISPTQESLKSLFDGVGVYLGTIHGSGPVMDKVFSSLRHYKLNLPEASRDRCLGTAVEVALAIIQGPSVDMSRRLMRTRKSGGNCRILVCAGGPNTYGPGSVPHSFSHPNYPYMEKTAIKWMEHLGQEAHFGHTIVDILCAGQCPVRVPVLQPLAKSSGGVLVLHDDFGEAFGVNLQRASTRAAGSHGLFEIRCSDDILVTQVVGPGEEAPADSPESFKNDSSFRIQMHSVEETQSFALSMETKGGIKNDYVYFQFAVRYSNLNYADISRVITVRLPTVESVSTYLASIQEDVAAVLIAKRTLLHARTSSEAVDMRLTVDERVKDIALNFGSQLPQSKLYQFPKELSALPEMLFHLRRGPLLGNIVGHEDERSVLRNLFLNASFDLSLRMLAPRCLMHREGGTFEELPAYDLIMQTHTAVVLDHGTDVFIWLGAELAAEQAKNAAALAACKTLAEELSMHRFPAPRILAFKEGSSQARYFVSRLIPAHKDPPYDQEKRFPQLQTLTKDQRVKLKSSLLHFDDYSFCEWIRSLKMMPP